MKTPMLFGIVGPMRTGKDTFASWLVKYCGFKQFAVADRIKNEYFRAIGYTNEQFEIDKETVRAEEVRNCLWKYSDEIKGVQGDDYFVNLLLHDIKECGCDTVVTDIRTQNELNAFCTAGFQIVLVTNVVPPENDSRIPGSRLNWSEIPCSAICLENFGTLDCFIHTIEKTFKKLRKKFDTKE